MSEEMESIKHLIGYFENYLIELALELQNDPDDLFIQGKIKGVQHALQMARMYIHAGNNS